MNSGHEPNPKAQTPPELRPPQHPEPPVIPDHQLLQRIGRGSYGEVWLARSVTGAYRAVKIVYRQDFDHERPFEREFSGILKFEPVYRKHDSQMDILHVGRGDGCFFYVMELADDQITGQQVNPGSYAPKSLQSEMFHRGKLPFDECVQISLSLTTALENLHSEGLVHRDIKPSNVIYVNGVVKLADIGLVTSVDASRSFVGTEGFVPPEGPGTPQADLYSLGKLLYELCTGKDRQDFPELPANLDAWPDREGLLELNTVIAKACREDPRQRYPSAQAMHEELLLLQSGKSLARLHAAQRTLAKVKGAAVAFGAVVLVLAAGLSVATIGWRQTSLERDKALQARAREETQRKAAQSARIVADVLAQRASESEQQSRRLLYASDMHLAQQELKDNNLGEARRLLDRHRPQPGEEDLRGWEWRYLWQLTRNTALVTLTNRPVRGFSVSFSPDGSRLAVGWFDGRVELWDVPGRRCVRTLTERQDRFLIGWGTVYAGHVAFSPVRNLLAATSETNAVALYDLDSGRDSVLWRSPGQGEWGVRDLEFSQDGSRVVIYAGSDTKKLGDEVWVVNVSSAKIESRHPTPFTDNQHFGRAQLSPDNQRLYLSHSDLLIDGHSIQCLDLATGQELWQTDPLQDPGLTALAISPDGRILASGAGFEDPTIHVWDAATGRLLHRLEGHTRWVGKLAFSRDGRRLISAAADQSIRLWDTGAWTEAKVLRGHRDEVHAVAISETGHLLASASKDGDLMLWNEQGNQANDGYLRLPGKLLQVMPLDGSWVTLFHSDSSPELFDLSRGASLGSMPGLGPWTNLCDSATNWVCRWDGTNQIVIDQWSGSQFARRGAVKLDSETRPAAVLFNPARQLVAWNETAASNSIFLATLATSGRRIEFKSEIAGLVPFNFSHDGKYLATVGPAGAALRVWDMDTRQSVVTLSEMIRDVDFAVGGQVLVALVYSQENHEIRFYDLDHPDQAPRRVPGKHAPCHLVESPDGRLVAATTDSGMVRLCDAVTGQLIEDLQGHLNATFGVAFSKDGSRLISACGGLEAVKLWDVGTRQELLNLSGAGSLLKQALWSADGDTILAGRPGEALWQAWHAPSWEEIAAAEANDPLLQGYGGQSLPSPGHGGQGKAEPQSSTFVVASPLKADDPAQQLQTGQWIQGEPVVSTLASDGKPAEAEKPLNRLLADTNDTAPETVEDLTTRANILAQGGQWREAAANLKLVIEKAPSEHWNWYVLAPLLIQSGQIVEYRSHCKAVLNRFGATSDPIAGGRAAKACLLYPSAVGPEELKLANKLADNVVASGENSPFLPWYQLTKGLAEYRQGHFASAAQWMERIQKEPKLDALPNTCRADTYLVLAMARRQLNQSDEARVALARGLEIVRTKLPKLDSGDLGEWYDVLMTYILMREAKEIAEGPHDGELQ